MLPKLRLFYFCTGKHAFPPRSAFTQAVAPMIPRMTTKTKRYTTLPAAATGGITLHRLADGSTMTTISPIRRVNTPSTRSGWGRGLRCPRCTCADFSVRWTNPVAKGLSRGRECLHCGWKGTTVETFKGIAATPAKRKSGKRPPTA